MDMGIDADRRDAEPETENQVGSLATDTREGEQCRFLGRDVSAELVPQDTANLFELRRLRIVETGRIDGLRYAVDSELGKPIRRRCDLEEAAAGPGCTR